MALRTSDDLAKDLEAFGLKGKVVGCHSNVAAIGLIAPTPVSAPEEKRGLSPIAKTVIDGFLKAVGPEGTFFVPTHSLNFISGYAPEQLKIDLKKDAEGKVITRTLLDDGYYRKETSPSLVGALTQSVVLDDRVVRSEHPSHSTAGIGKEAKYLAQGHTPLAQPVGIQNAFAKTVGLDGVIFFVGDTLKSNTTFHAYETLFLPKLAEYYPTAVAADFGGLKRIFAQRWVPSLHRDFYDEHKRRTRAVDAMRKSGLLQEGKVGRGTAYAFPAKAMAKYFADHVFPNEPDIMYCAKKEDCSISYDCAYSIAVLRSLYGKGKGWDAGKIKSDMDKQFLKLMEPGIQRVPA